MTKCVWHSHSSVTHRGSPFTMKVVVADIVNAPRIVPASLSGMTIVAVVDTMSLFPISAQKLGHTCRLTGNPSSTSFTRTSGS